ncbi:MAG: hypothetical protein J6R47_03585 [Acholeplasmatales bacterium]|nr:hypothetical protein [Acholeplasmatales bacterium]
MATVLGNWYFNDTITGTVAQDVIFTYIDSSGVQQQCSRINFSYSGNNLIGNYTINGVSTLVYESNGRGWESEAFKIITIADETSTDALFNFLNANADHGKIADILHGVAGQIATLATIKKEFKDIFETKGIEITNDFTTYPQIMKDNMSGANGTIQSYLAYEDIKQGDFIEIQGLAPYAASYYSSINILLQLDNKIFYQGSDTDIYCAVFDNPFTPTIYKLSTRVGNTKLIGVSKFRDNSVIVFFNSTISPYKLGYSVYDLNTFTIIKTAYDLITPNSSFTGTIYKFKAVVINDLQIAYACALYNSNRWDYSFFIVNVDESYNYVSNIKSTNSYSGTSGFTPYFYKKSDTELFFQINQDKTQCYLINVEDATITVFIHKVSLGTYDYLQTLGFIDNQHVLAYHRVGASSSSKDRYYLRLYNVTSSGFTLVSSFIANSSSNVSLYIYINKSNPNELFVYSSENKLYKIVIEELTFKSTNLGTKTELASKTRLGFIDDGNIWVTNQSGFIVPVLLTEPKVRKAVTYAHGLARQDALANENIEVTVANLNS